MRPEGTPHPLESSAAASGWIDLRAGHFGSRLRWCMEDPELNWRSLQSESRAIYSLGFNSRPRIVRLWKAGTYRMGLSYISLPMNWEAQISSKLRAGRAHS